jgi:hypothetical protein
MYYLPFFLMFTGSTDSSSNKFIKYKEKRKRADEGVTILLCRFLFLSNVPRFGVWTLDRVVPLCVGVPEAIHSCKMSVHYISKLGEYSGNVKKKDQCLCENCICVSHIRELVTCTICTICKKPPASAP